jgi:hypothetical protein
MKKNPKDPKHFEQKKKNNQYNDAQNQMKKHKNKEKEPKPNTRGARQTILKDKRLRNKHK